MVKDTDLILVGRVDLDACHACCVMSQLMNTFPADCAENFNSIATHTQEIPAHTDRNVNSNLGTQETPVQWGTM